MALFVAALLLGAGCARKGAVAPGGPSPDAAAVAEARVLYDRFHAAASPGAGFSAAASMNLETPSARRRVLLRLWGDAAGPVRLDLLAGVGVTAGLWREGPEGFTAFMPQAATAYRYPSGREGLAAFGLPSPFSLRELALALCGDFAQLFPSEYGRVRVVPGTGFEYSFPRKEGEWRLVLDAAGRPVSCAGGAGESAWRLEVPAWADGNAVAGPERLILEWQGGKASLYVREAGFRPDPWPERSLALDLPPGTRLVTVERHP
ncbi:MAG: hypothetical protein H0S85_04125 [Desulfovibrionaceae bacterium]|nr:hypothetical protein [Desulfovibrionaceae bacterium]